MLDENSVQRIITHMNDDHADAVLLYAKAFAGCDQATSARLVSFDERGMGIQCMEGGVENNCRVEFELPLAHVGEQLAVDVSLGP